jgi:hypothetical protein
MKKIKMLIGSLAGIILTASNALAAANDTNVTGNLGAASGVGADILSLVKWGAVFIAIITILALWGKGNLDRLRNHVSDAVKSMENKKGWFIDCILVIVGLIFLYEYVIPKLNGMV